MIGDPAAVVLSEAYVKGFRGFNVEEAFAAVLKNADVPQPDDMDRNWDDSGRDMPGCPETRGGLTWYLKHGYVAQDLTRESVSRTLDFSLADSSISKFAAALGKKDEARRFASRALNFTNLWNEAEGAFLPRNRDRSWVNPSQLVWNTRAYVETDKRSARWCVPHDVEKLVELMGGKEVFERELDGFFEKEFYRTDTVGNLSVHGNETCHHVAYLYNRIGAFDKTCRRVRDILTRCYSSTRRGFDGNEDCGAMSSWYILSSLGFYPLDPASGEYELGAPLVDGAEIQVKGGVLKIRVKKSSKNAWRTVRVCFNGEELSSRRISHAKLVSGGVLEFELD
jgi:predicted alpha-1,2-mannosidase